MEELIKSFIRPELLMLVPVCYIAGATLKASKAFKDEHIPFLLGAFGVALALLYMFSVTDVYSVRGCVTLVFTGVTQGILCSGASVYCNQIGVQARKMKEEPKE